ncbi:hypothetical protein ARMA_1092 [Ardenticatena maritima]|uniref:Uncharacterized protein n=1 Tax=Ardenticatena maritima TaxID=872965 RepID=A0A0M8K8J9_9CHLR|nr:hypothetical protein ARMA_1092 [Ardenticatena maritima]
MVLTDSHFFAHNLLTWQHKKQTAWRIRGLHAMRMLAIVD